MTPSPDPRTTEDSRGLQKYLPSVCRSAAGGVSHFYHLNVRILTLIGGQNQERGPSSRDDRTPEAWRRLCRDRALVEALRDSRIRRLARSVDGLPASALTILLDFTDVLRAVEGLPPETADL